MPQGLTRPSLLRRLLKWCFGIGSLLLVLLVVVSLFRIPINLGGFRGAVEAAATGALGRTVRVDGNITVTTSLWPYFEISGLSVANPEGFPTGELARMNRARLSVGLMSLLLRGKLRLQTIEVEGLELALRRLPDGRVNWVFRSGEGPAVDTAGASDGGRASLKSLTIDDIDISDISVVLEDEAAGERHSFQLTEATGSAPIDRPMSIEMRGNLDAHPYVIDVRSSSLTGVLTGTDKRMSVELDIAETRFVLTGASAALGDGIERSAGLTVEGDSLASLDALLAVDLPPIEDYRLEASVRSIPDRLELSALDLAVGESRVTGSASIDASGARPRLDAELRSELIQLGDFDVGDWSPESRPGRADGAPAAKLLSPESLERLDAALSIRVDDVRSGSDELGRGELNLSLVDGRITIDPLRLESDVGRLELRSSVKPGQEASDARLQLEIEGFDLGALSRLSDPDSTIGGEVNVAVDVTSAARRSGEILANASGYFDVQVRPENLRAGVVDLWAVNLVSSVVGAAVRSDEPSTINCVLSRWAMDDGVLTSRQVAVDTTRIRICADGEIDFPQRGFSIVAAPTPKRAEFFSLATPIEVTGTFEDFDVGTEAGLLSIGQTAVRFAISPVTTPLNRLFRGSLPAAGEDVCELPIGPHPEEMEKLPGC